MKEIITDSKQNRKDLNDRPVNYEEEKKTKVLPQKMNIKIEDGTIDTPPKKIANSKENVMNESIKQSQKLPESTKSRPVISDKTLTKEGSSLGSLNQKGFKTNFNTLSRGVCSNQITREPSGCLTVKKMINDNNKNKTEQSSFNCENYREMSKTPIPQAKYENGFYYNLPDKRYF